MLINTVKKMSVATVVGLTDSLIYQKHMQLCY